MFDVIIENQFYRCFSVISIAISVRTSFIGMKRMWFIFRGTKMVSIWRGSCGSGRKVVSNRLVTCRFSFAIVSEVILISSCGFLCFLFTVGRWWSSEGHVQTIRGLDHTMMWFAEIFLLSFESFCRNFFITFVNNFRYFRQFIITIRPHDFDGFELNLGVSWYMKKDTICSWQGQRIDNVIKNILDFWNGCRNKKKSYREINCVSVYFQQSEVC